MIKYNFVLTPAHFRCPCDPLSASLVSAGAGLAGNILGFIGQNKANKTAKQISADTNAANLQVARETNQANLDMYNLQHSNSVNDWRMQMAYESPAALRARLIQAGINPAVMASSNINGSASVQQPSSAPAVGTTFQGYDYKSPLSSLSSTLGTVGNDAVNMFFMAQRHREDLLKTAQERYALSIDNTTRAERNLVSLNKAISELEQQKYLTEQQKEQLAEYKVQRDRNIALYNNSLREQDQNYENLVKLGQKTDREVKRIERQTVDEHLESLQRISSMKNKDIVDLYNAHTQRKLATSESRRLEAEADNIYLMLPYNIKKSGAEIRDFKVTTELKRLEKRVKSLDIEQRTYLAFMFAIKAQRENTMSQSYIRFLVNRLFGLDIQDILSPLSRLTQ